MKNGDSGSSSETSQRPTKKPRKGERRAARLKSLRPDLAPLIQKTISKVDAIRLGGYTSVDAMINDLNAREAAQRKVAAKAK